MKLEEERGAGHQDEGEVYMMVHAYHAWPMTTTAISSRTQWQLEVKHGLSYLSARPSLQEPQWVPRWWLLGQVAWWC